MAPRRNSNYLIVSDKVNHTLNVLSEHLGEMLHLLCQVFLHHCLFSRTSINSRILRNHRVLVAFLEVCSRDSSFEFLKF